MVSPALLLPLILSSLISTAFSLTCIECVGPGDKPCHGPTVTCPPDTVCVATVESNTKDGKDMTIRQYCGKSSMCSYSGSLTTSVGVRRISSACCYTSNCSPSVPKFPTEKTDKNGISCKTCVADKETSCDSEIDCTGDEKECVSMSIISKTGLLSPSAFLRGCGTPGWCKIEDREIQYGEQTAKITITCSKGSDALPPGRPLLLLAAFLIMKVIY